MLPHPERLVIAADVIPEDSARARLLAMVQSMTEEDVQAVLKYIGRQKHRRA